MERDFEPLSYFPFYVITPPAVATFWDNTQNR